MDACAEVTAGYLVAGVYDENGDLVASTSCAYTFVANEAKVLAFEVIDLQSSRPAVRTKFKIHHKGKLHGFELHSLSHRQDRDRPGRR